MTVASCDSKANGGPVDDEDREMKEMAKSVARMEHEPHPYRDRLAQMMRTVTEVGSIVNDIGDRWRVEYLERAEAHDKTRPEGQDFENYSKPLLVAVGMLRKQVGFKDLAHLICLKAVDLTDRHCAATGRDLHRGAMYAHLGITYFERRQFELGMSWLLAAANEDVRFNRVPNVYGSYALSDSGILGQWVEIEIMPVLQPGVLGFVNSQLGTAYGFAEVMKVFRSLAGTGDLNLMAGLINFSDMRGRNDYMAHSVRFTCLRDLATLTEVFLKHIGENHADANVRVEYAGSPTMGNIVHHMHYQHNSGQRAANSALKAHKNPGLFHNTVAQRNDLLAAVDAGFDSIKDFNAVSIADVRTYLNATSLFPVDADTDALAKRYLLAYRLRNETSHSFQPESPGIVAHAEEFRLWLLQAVFYSYFYFRDSGQVVF